MQWRWNAQIRIENVTGIWFVTVVVNDLLTHFWNDDDDDDSDDVAADERQTLIY